MVVLLSPKNSSTALTNQNCIEQLATKILLKSIELLGGLNKLAQHRNLTWLASLAGACIAIVLKEEYLKSEENIAEYLDISSATVRKKKVS